MHRQSVNAYKMHPCPSLSGLVYTFFGILRPISTFMPSSSSSRFTIQLTDTMPIKKCLKQSLASIRQKTKILPSRVHSLKQKICNVLMKPTNPKDTVQLDFDSGYGGSADTLCEASYSLPPVQFPDTPTLASAYFSRMAPADGSVQFPRFGEPERGSTPVTYYPRRRVPVTFDEIAAAMAMETARRHQPQIIYAPREATRHESSAAMICSTADATPERDEQPTEADLLLESRLAAAQQACM